MNRRKIAFLTTLLGMLSATHGFSEDKTSPPLEAQCAAPFGDNAVLQQGIPLPIWGTSQPGARVTVSYDGQTKSTQVDQSGAWKVALDPLTAVKLESSDQVPEGKTLTIVTKLDGKMATKQFENIVAGELWLCAGQSNIAGKLKTKTPYRFPPETQTEANYPGLRHMLHPSQPWHLGTPESVGEFKKVSFYFARPLFEKLLVPVGLVPAAVGGSNIESWLNQNPYEQGKNHKRFIEPIIGCGLRGAIWYQGESNANDGLHYLPKLRALIEGWRNSWQTDDFPVYFVQLPGRGNPERGTPAGGGPWPEIRQAQFEALALKNTGMAITIDIGDRSVHPPNKYDTGERLARLALHHTYGVKELAPSGPLYRSHRVDGSTIRVQFDHAGNGLMLAEKEGFPPPKRTSDKKLEWLAIQAKDGTWHWADGIIDGSELVVSSQEVTDPIAVRYNHVSRPVGCMLYNNAGLPAAPFSTCGYGDKANTTAP